VTSILTGLPCQRTVLKQRESSSSCQLVASRPSSRTRSGSLQATEKSHSCQARSKGLSGISSSFSVFSYPYPFDQDRPTIRRSTGGSYLLRGRRYRGDGGHQDSERQHHQPQQVRSVPATSREHLQTILQEKNILRIPAPLTTQDLLRRAPQLCVKQIWRDSPLNSSFKSWP